MRKALPLALSAIIILFLASSAPAQIGPDVIALDTFAPVKYGTVGDITGYVVSTTSCNLGDMEAIWEQSTNEHPLIGMQIYRLKDGRLEQLGMSWLKHSFCAVNEPGCGTCQMTPCSTLGIGCADTYGTALNADQTQLGPRSEVNAATGAYSYPFTGQGVTGDSIFKRIQVHNDDMNPALNDGARYFTEVHYLTTDEQAWGNQFNNVSHREIFVGNESNGGWEIFHTLDFLVQAEAPALQAWQDADPEVVIQDVFVPADGLIKVGMRATSIGGNMWHYEYAVYNMNSDRSVQSFTVPIPAGVNVTNIGFHDVDYHSGEPFDGTDWTANLSGGNLTWNTETFAENANANAIRWSTTYNFRFDASTPPSSENVDGTLGLFKPGAISMLPVGLVGPALPGAFLRGDCDGTSNIQLADALILLGVMFQGTPAPDCVKACDFDDSGTLQLADAIQLLTFLFLQGPPPELPFPDPGEDPTPDMLPCM